MIWRAAATVATAMVVLVAGTLVVLLGPALSAQWLGRTDVENLRMGTTARQYRVYRPAAIGTRPGLVVDLHSAHTNGLLEEVATRFDGQADRRGWLVAYPDGVADGWEPFGCCHHDGVDDVAFIAGLIDRLRATDGVDPDRVYVTGLSRGGMMAYRLGCELSSKLAAIAPVEGNMADERGDVRGVACRPDRPVSVLAIHGTADTAIPIGGSERFGPFTDVVGRWRELDGCAPPPAVTATGPGPESLETLAISRDTTIAGTACGMSVEMNRTRSP